MNTSIRFATLQLYPGYDADHNTISKAIAVYEQEKFLLANNEIDKHPFTSVKEVTTLAERATRGEYSLLLPQFVWHLN